MATLDVYFELEKLKKENAELKSQLQSITSRIVVVDGWKGKDKIKILWENEGWTIIEHRKEKKTDEIKQGKHHIPDKNVQVIWQLIKEQCFKIGDKTKYRKLVPKIIEYYKLTDVDMESFNGGKNRNKYLFKYYYYPLKVLEISYKFIEYSGGGIITRLF